MLTLQVVNDIFSLMAQTKIGEDPIVTRCVGSTIEFEAEKNVGCLRQKENLN